ncbi:MULTISPECIES: FGGY family carbohydrate kinase [unclassified Chelatococcus]|uniref:FGGY family carbohydrate kinase n=1 Tax=unclassified Chelatococcus TaxID=2638111 RepID=UPI000303DA54|nr:MULTISPECIES: FGGY family carbohydrate kinase [unclassified Chelatococcus]ALA19925.1 carbohydrate kinase [Chelatococcus sp. CO-6]
MAGMRAGGVVAVFDVGKTNIKLSAVDADGHVLETLSVANPVREGPPWRHHDLAAIRGWLLDGLGTLAKRHALQGFVPVGHGSGGVLALADPDMGDGAALPMIDYEQPLPEDIREAYAPLAGPFLDRGSALMHGATHQARQLFWMEREAPAAVAAARWYLGIPQYWAWVMSGVAVSEASVLGAQSHLWNVPERSWAAIVRDRGWERLMPPFARAWQAVGRLRPTLVTRHGLPQDLAIFAGGHDSSVNYYRYQAAGLRAASVVSTGTWIVGLSGGTPLARLDEHRGMTCNSDVFGAPLGGVLSMGGREFAAIAGPDAPAEPVAVETAARLAARGTMAMPSFGDSDSLFPGSAGRGHIRGEPPATPAERKALAVLHCALLTAECLDALGPGRDVVLDGSFVREPLYPALVAAFAPDRRVRFSLDAYGVAAGAALLAGHGERSQPAPVDLSEAGPLPPVFIAYAERWREAVRRDALAAPTS